LEQHYELKILYIYKSTLADDIITLYAHYFNIHVSPKWSVLFTFVKYKTAYYHLSIISYHLHKTDINVELQMLNKHLDSWNNTLHTLFSQCIISL